MRLFLVLLLLLPLKAHAFMSAGGGGAGTVTLHGTDRTHSMGYTNQLNSSRPSNYVMGEFRVPITTMRYECKNPRFVYCNWGLASGETAGPNTIYIKAGYENLGTTTPISFSGQQTATVASGACVTTDALNITIPKETQFINRIAIQVPDNTGSFFDGASGTGVYTARTLADSQVYNTGSLVFGTDDSPLQWYSYVPQEVLCDMKPGGNFCRNLR